MPLAKAFSLFAEIEIPEPGPEAFEIVDGDKSWFCKKQRSQAECFKVRVFFLKYNVERKRISKNCLHINFQLQIQL
jgi:hypothetical protein